MKKNRLAGVFQARQTVEREQRIEPPPAQRDAEEVGRSNPANKRLYIHTSLYLTRKTHAEARAALLQDEGDEDLSQLVDRLLFEWLESRRRSGA